MTEAGAEMSGRGMYEFLEYQTQDVMSRDVITVRPDSKLSDVSEVFALHDFNALPVLAENGDVLGLVTQLDLLRAFQFDDEHMFPPYAEIMQRPVSLVMNREVKTVRPRTALHKVLRMMVELGSKSFPVVDADGLVGMVAREDVMRGLTTASRGERPAPGEESF